VHGGCSYCVLIIFIRNHDSHVSSYTLQTIFRMMRYRKQHKRCVPTDCTLCYSTFPSALHHLLWGKLSIAWHWHLLFSHSLSVLLMAWLGSLLAEWQRICFSIWAFGAAPFNKVMSAGGGASIEYMFMIGVLCSPKLGGVWLGPVLGIPTYFDCVSYTQIRHHSFCIVW